MSDETKTRSTEAVEQLIQELAVLRQRVAELEASKAERKRAEEALRGANERMVNILESISDGFFTLDNELIVTYFNKAAEELLGRNSAEVLEAAWAAAARCHLMLVVGTSAVVHPAASLPLVALRNGARLVEVNPTETPLSAHAHEILRGPAAKVLPGWWETQLSNHRS